MAVDSALPQDGRPAKLHARQVLLVANGDLRLAANQTCWAAQAQMEESLHQAANDAGYELIRAHPFKPHEQHGFIGSQKEGMEVFAGIDREAPLIVAEATWQYSHHILHGLLSHEGPILTVANWSGTWPGLVGMLNLNGSLTKAGSEIFDAVERGFFRRLLPPNRSAVGSRKANCGTTSTMSRRWPT